MRFYLASVALSGLFGSSASAQTPGSSPDLAITRVTVVDVERGELVPNQDVLISGDRILAVSPAGRTRLAAGVRRVDGNRMYLIPGLWDMHAHLGLGGFPSAQLLAPFVAHGITGIRVMNTPIRPGSLGLFRTVQGQIAAGNLLGPRILAIGTWAVNGTRGLPDSVPAFYKASTREEGQQLARHFKEAGYDFVKIYNGVSREGYFGLAEEARRLGLPFAGHEPASLSAIELSNAGQASLEHSRIFLLNCFGGADSLQKGQLPISPTMRRRRMVDEYDPAKCAEVFRTFVQNGTWITPTHLTRKMDAFADDSAYRADSRMKYIPLRQRAAWLADADGMVAEDTSRAGRKSYMDFYLKGLALTSEAYRAGVRVMLGTDASDSFVFPGASVHDELGELVKAGLTPAEALRAATLAGAQFLGRTADFGTVQAGRFADLVLLEANPLVDIGSSRRIRAVVLGGRVLERAALDSMLMAIEVAARPNPQEQLWVGAFSGDSAMIVSALDAGARIDSLDPGGNRRPLNYAAFFNRAAAVRVLLARGADINLTNGTGFTPVHHAAEGGAADALSVLIAAGADITIPNARGVVPLDTAKRRGNQAIIKPLEEAAARRP